MLGYCGVYVRCVPTDTTSLRWAHVGDNGRVFGDSLGESWNNEERTCRKKGPAHRLIVLLGVYGVTAHSILRRNSSVWRTGYPGRYVVDRHLQNRLGPGYPATIQPWTHRSIQSGRTQGTTVESCRVIARLSALFLRPL
jgi:hypothetical protein